eukprot:TRINITY_DN4387_c0_g1_i1.p1 TRINITY_DN4387_c0_g1~~TRINITY_DN4387_c0_g1_i1.p1  ORF type:complete len:383 (+),score=53.14 TRINITY_DN4387_c0_g1_i1:26-1150(+)
MGQQIENLIRVHSITYLTSLLAQRWLSSRLEAMSSLVMTGVVAFAVGLRKDVDSTVSALAIINIMQMVGLFQWAVRISIEVENNMTSVERLNYYSDIAQEAAYSIPETLPQGWPSQGAVTFENICLKYRPELPAVLKGVSCSIRPGEKIGICGRTGAGKSSLTVALYRLAELSGGSISIDGVDISTLGLGDLRSRLSIIPQDPVLFNGTVRYNLDPFRQYTDQQIWQALERAYLADNVRGLTSQLEFVVAERGENFSFGQRQLICIARALLRNAKVLILDEATAGVDSETDQLIQMSIRQNFADCTVLTIAHRLHTIIDADRIILLSQGEIAEMDKPITLLQDESSLFSRLVSETGPNMRQQLLYLAQNSVQKS